MYDSTDDSTLRPHQPLPLSPQRNPPTIEQNGLLFESKHINNLHVIDELDGTIRPITVSVETAAVDTGTGAKQFSTSAAQIISANGMPTTLDRLVRCRGCTHGYRYTEHAATLCNDCQIVLGIPCCARGQTIPRCKVCRRRQFWKMLWRTITTLR
jgi:hypothetical protein